MPRYPDFPPAVGFTLNSSEHAGVAYELLEVLGEGGKGVAYKAVQRGGDRDGRHCVVKFPRLDTRSYSLEQIQERLEELNRALRTEVEAMDDLVETAGIASILELGGRRWQVKKDGRKEILNIFHTVYDFVEGPDLDRWAEQTFPDASGAFRGIPIPERWFMLARQLFEVLDTVHHQRVVHGDLWPHNVKMPEDEVPVLIDFGQAWSLDRDFEKQSADFKAHPYLAPERYVFGEQVNRWYATADIYSMGGILFYLATGQPPLSPWIAEVGGPRKPNRKLKQEIAHAIQEANPALYQANHGVVDIILSCLAPTVENRARHARAVLDTIDAFDGAHLRRGERVEEFAKALGQVRHELKKLRRIAYATNPVFRNIVLRRIRTLRDDLSPLSSRVFSIVGDREAHVNGVLDCVSMLGEGDELIAVTTARFWRKDNFGPYGRLSAMLSMAALRGASIRWMLLAQDPLSDEDVDVLEYQRRSALDHLESRGIHPREYGLGTSHYVSYRLLPAEEVELIRRKRDTFILLRVDSDWTLIAPDYSAASGSVSIVRLWADPRRKEELLKEYDKHHRYSTPISRFERP